MPQFVSLLAENEHLFEACSTFYDYIKSPRFCLKNKQDLWKDVYQKFYDMLVQSGSYYSSNKMVLPGDRKHLREDSQIEVLFKEGLEKFTSQQGLLWSYFATFYVRQGNFERAKAVYREALEVVKSVKDFSLVFDAFAKFQELFIQKKFKRLEKIKRNQGKDLEVIQNEINHCLEEFQDLLSKREVLLNEVLLRKTPNSVPFWLQRLEIFKKYDVNKVPEIFSQAVQTINPQKATYGSPAELFIIFTKFIMERGTDEHHIRQVIIVFEKAIDYGFRTPQELADIWIAYGQFLTTYKNVDDALENLSRATKPITAGHVDFFNEEYSAQERLFKSVKLWQFVLTLEKSTNSIPRVRSTFDHIIELKIATPALILDYGAFLELHSMLEESFKVYERGIDLFGYPVAFDLWNIYLPKIIRQYRGSQLQRIRELFEHALVGVPPQFAKPLYVMYGSYEESYGLLSKALSIYRKATHVVLEGERLALYEFCLAKVIKHQNLLAARPLFQEAMENLPDREAREIALRFATFEEKLGEVERARAIYAYGGQLGNPVTCREYWDKWQQFEVANGDQDTLREMLRIKRSVQSQYQSSMLQFVPASNPKQQSLSGSNSEIDSASFVAGSNPMATLENSTLETN